MNEQQILALIRREIQANESRNRFTTTKVPYHTHNGTDSLPIQANNVVPSTSIIGNVEFSQQATYIINLNSAFTPQRIFVNGTISGLYGGVQVRGTFNGVAQLTPTLYLQPSTPTSVITGTKQYPFNGFPAQCSSFVASFREPYNFGTGTVSNPVFAGSSEFHIASIFMPTTSDTDIQARATITNFSSSSITVDIPILEPNWTLFINFVIT